MTTITEGAWLQQAGTVYDALIQRLVESDQCVRELEGKLERAKVEQRRLAKAADAVEPLARASRAVEQLDKGQAFPSPAAVLDIAVKNMKRP